MATPTTVEHPGRPQRRVAGTVQPEVPMACPVDAGWAIVEYLQIPGPGRDLWVYPHYWTGPNIETWHGTGGPVPCDAALFPTEAAARAVIDGWGPTEGAP